MEDPHTGVFTDGSAVPNPGPGGWGVVYVVDDEVVAERSGHDPDTTNNRMELTALVEALDVIPEGMPMTVYSDSNLAVRTITEWAAGWEKRGWKRKSGPVENLDLVKKAYLGYRRRPETRAQVDQGSRRLQMERVRRSAGVPVARVMIPARLEPLFAEGSSIRLLGEVFDRGRARVVPGRGERA